MLVVDKKTESRSLEAIPAAPEPSRLRADAARNRARVLQAAERLFAAEDPRQVTMGDIARAAGVGRATLYRSYPTPASVATALLDEHERRLQENLVRGDPPLGPGAAPADRLAAFYAAMTGLLERHLPLALGAETGSARFRTGAYGFWRVHVRTLLIEAGTSGADHMIDVLLAPLAPELFQYRRHELGHSTEEITASLEKLAHQVLTERN
ncbi:TetR family transcriptional regulator [Saccharopolyspora erythraea NRRL 2338]|uniref:Transcriptional regulator n=1 Tax=Saccharopolyspora erythraea (strain ATCC 11635 / DSM 40517 / JCM 4748 / NBRC 13426 / NCIMB 8594 / NRRL 2338) TaxID=405948 RepID=A4FI12_SACEN|nr:TetR family transcriptional regulator [Saccharopolyspora erythraea D]PFG97371.1 TetR family transcriptional regulator [Saccharopolyspora erythraea NRRL 2338]CAM03687.1 putative transcriptional regulator [Saccharopolyspora erythraea NRRL 2338]